MTPETFHQSVNELKLGKKLPKAIYLHKSAIERLSSELRGLVLNQVKTLELHENDWDLMKFHRDSFRLTLLSYPDFFEEAYPALQKSVSIDLAKGRCKETSYKNTDNPPILHRKESMISPSHASYEEFCDITKEGEIAGLYENSRIIGFKRTWNSLIESKGYMLVDGRLFRQAAVQPSREKTIDRHKTALLRDGLSTPMKSLAKHGYLEGQFSVFDYGCGHGDDICELEAHGIDVQGWDPNWKPDGVKVKADLVNLGFVINVIEDFEERVAALFGAWSLTDKLIVVSAMLASEGRIKKFRSYKDGVITSRNTFQKYYSQAELHTFIEQVLDEEPIAIGPGLFYIFRDKNEEQRYLSKKQIRSGRWKQMTQRNVRIPKSQALFEKNTQLFESFWRTCLDLGRLPANDEFENSGELNSLVSSMKRAFKFACEKYDKIEFEQAETERREDLLVYFALQLFCKRSSYKSMPEELKRDIKAHFGSYTMALNEAKELLFSLAKPDTINQACEQAHQELPASILHNSHSLILHSRFVNNLPPELRVYIGCAAQLFSETDGVDLVKVHIRSGKLTLMIYEGFESQPLPLLKERIKINMRSQRVEFFDYEGGDYESQPLYWKSKLIDESFNDFQQQKSFDKRLVNLEVKGFEGEFGPSLDQLIESLKQDHALEIKGYRFFSLQ